VSGPRPRALTIAGSDSGGGAGIQADLKTFQANGCYGLSVITALTAQNTRGVQGVHAVPEAFIRAQLDSVMEDIGCDAAKTGMLASASLIGAVAESVAKWRIERLVVDPVMVSKSGHRLLAPDAVAALVERLLPYAAVVTPNLEEVAGLLGKYPRNVVEMMDAAKAMAKLGPRAVVVKGGHLTDLPQAVDVLFDGTSTEILRAPRSPNRHTHGTGCTLSAAIAAGLAKGLPVRDAVAAAKDYLTGAIEHAWPLGKGIGPVDHAWRMG
jgi:hydroxymethylpyrimidine/phosphomethylpyrimidine kinase